MHKYFVLKKIKEEIKTGRGNKTTAPKKTNITKRIMYLIVFQSKTNFL